MRIRGKGVRSQEECARGSNTSRRRGLVGRGRQVAGLFSRTNWPRCRQEITRRGVSIQMEVYFYLDLHCDGFVVSHCGGKFPLLHGVHGCFIKFRTKRSRDFNVARQAVGTNNKRQYNCPLVACFALFFRKLGVRSIGRAGRFHTFPHPVDRLRRSPRRVILTKCDWREH